MGKAEVDKKVEDNINLVYATIRKRLPNVVADYFNGDFEEVVRIGMFGLFKACKAHTDSKGTIGTFATMCITNEILQTIRDLKKRKHIQAYSINYSLSFDSDITLEDTLANKLDLEDYALYQDCIRRSIHRTRAVLSPSKRRTFDTLIKTEETRAKELAEMCGLTKQTVWKQLTEIKPLFKQYLEEEFNNEKII